MSKYSISEIRDEYKRLDALCGIDSRYIPVNISTKAIKQYGCCRWRKVKEKCYVKSITIADFILDCNEQFWDTIRHEYAHMLVIMRTGKNHGHDAVWKAACKEVGCSPTRLAVNAEAHGKSVERRIQREKYEVKCLDCQRTWRYVKAGPVVKSLQKGSTKCSCPCGSHNLRLFELS